ncbi:hypothetical protein V492_07700 [Pseudogymnoascus sp. VKM F-4246]|nr:hypothetical protein V492_07700 [Pseudogymnoascus sp. VKM F-4246]
MNVKYDVCVGNDEGIHTCRFSSNAVRWILTHAPSHPELDVLAVNAINGIALEPVSDTTVRELSVFFAALAQYWLDLRTLNDGTGASLSLNEEVFVIATVTMAFIPHNVPLSARNQYSYFSDCRNPRALLDRWKLIEAEYLAQNPHMSAPAAEARLIYEVRRQMAHDLECSSYQLHPSLSTDSHLAGVDKRIFHRFESPPGVSEEFRPVIRRPQWRMPFMRHPEMALPILPQFLDERAIPATPKLHPISSPDSGSSDTSDRGGSNIADAGSE